MPNYGSSRIRTLIVTATGGTGPIGATGPTGNTGAYVTGPTGADGTGIASVIYDPLVDGITFQLSGGNAIFFTGIRGNTGIGPAPAPIVFYIGSGIQPLANTAGIDNGYTLQFRSITFSSGLSGSVSGNSIIIQDNITVTGSFDLGKLLEVKYSDTTSTYYLDSADNVNYNEYNYSGVSYSNFNVVRRFARDLLDTENFNYSRESSHEGLTLNMDAAFYGMTGTQFGLTYSYWKPYLKYRSNNFDVDNTSGITVGFITFSQLGPYNKTIKPEEAIGSCCYCDDGISDLDDRRKCVDYVSKTYCESILGRWSTSSCLQRTNTYDCYRRRACCVNGLCINTSKFKCEQMNGVFDGNNECGASYDCQRQFFGNPVPASSSLVCCCVNGVTYPDMKDSECLAMGGTSVTPGSCDGVNCCDYLNYGACCLQNGTCEITTPENCSAKLGLYKGTGTSCDPSPCCLPTT